MSYKVKVNLNNEYNVKLNSRNNYKVKLKISENIMAGSLRDLQDVVTSNLNSATNNYVLTYDSTSNSYVFVDPDVVLLAAANVPTNQVNVSGVPTAFANNVMDLSTEIIDGGNF